MIWCQFWLSIETSNSRTSCFISQTTTTNLCTWQRRKEEFGSKVLTWIPSTSKLKLPILAFQKSSSVWTKSTRQFAVLLCTWLHKSYRKKNIHIKLIFGPSEWYFSKCSTDKLLSMQRAGMSSRKKFRRVHITWEMTQRSRFRLNASCFSVTVCRTRRTWERAFPSSEITLTS